MARPNTYPKKTSFPAGAGFLGDSDAGVFFMEANPLMQEISKHPSLVHTELKDKVFSVASGSAVVVAYIQLHELHKYRMVVERISGSGSFSYGIKEGGVTDIYKLEGGVVTQNPATASDVATLWIYTTANAVFKVSACDVEESQAVFDERTLCRIAIDPSYYKTEEASATVHFYPLDIKSNVTYVVEVSGVKSGDQLSISGGTSGSSQKAFVSNYSLKDGLNRLKFTSDGNYDGLRFWLPNGGTIRVSSLETPSCSYTTTSEGTGLVVSSDALDTLFGGLVLITMPTTLYSEVKFVGEADTRRLSSGFSFHGREKIEKLKLMRVDGTTLSSLSATEAKEFKIYRISSKNPNYDVTIADGSLSEANECDASDFVVNRYNAQLIIQAAIACKSCNKILLYRGDYIMTSLHDCYCSKTGTTSRAMLSTFDGYIYNGDKVYREQKTIELVGNTAHLPENHDEPRTAYMPRIRVGYAVVSAISSDNCSGILIPKSDDNDLDGEGGASMQGASNTGTSLLMRNVVMQDDYMNGNKNFAFTDLTYADSVTLENCRVFSTNRLGSITTNDGLPLEGFVGFRFGRGSNKGIGCSVKHCYVEGVFYGYDCSGEHYLFEDCQVRHCVCAVRLGGVLTRWSQIHPVVFVGCDPVRALQVVGLSTEDSMNISGFLPSPKIGIVPKSKGAWSGKIDMVFRDKATDFDTQGVAINPLTGEGAENIVIDNMMAKFCGTTSERPVYYPYDGFRFFDKTLGKPVFAKVGKCAKIKLVISSTSASIGTLGFSIGGFYSPVKILSAKTTQDDVVEVIRKWLDFACYQDVEVNGNEITFINPRPRSLSAVLWDAGTTGISLTATITENGTSGKWVDASGNEV